MFVSYEIKKARYYCVRRADPCNKVAGVIMHLKAKRTGLMLSLGGDAMVISMQ